jgi:hypothetical protein
MPWHEWMYYISFLVGFIYAVVVFLLGNVVGGAEGAHDAGGHDIGGHDTGGHAAAGGHEVHFSPFSPVVISMFLASFGGTGILCIKLFEINNILKHLPISLAVGLGMGGLTFYFFYKVFSTVQGSVLPTDQDIIGMEAEVITGIPGHEQLGEIAYVAKGVRMNAPARSEDGTQIPAHTAVVVSKIVGTTTYVKPVRR